MKLGYPRRLWALFALLLSVGLLCGPMVRAEEDDENEPVGPPLEVPIPGSHGVPMRITADQTAVVNFEELSLQPASVTPAYPETRTWMPNEFEPPAEPKFPPAPEVESSTPITPFVASPGPFYSYQGLDDIAMVDSLYIIIPPDVAGGVGPTKVMEAFNNNYRIRNKTTGVTISTVGTATFWAPVVAVAERASLTDPRVCYDPYNNRWLTAMQTVTTGAAKLLIGVSQTSDPSGAWFLYSFNSAKTCDFPILGFNKNWITYTINGYTSGGVFDRGLALVIDYGQARTGTGTGTLFTQAAGTHFCTSPAITYSATEDTLFLVTHLSSGGATYSPDKITGTPSAPVYTSGGTLTRTGGGWTQPSGNQLPQSAPNSGTSACGATPCKMESQDAQVRSAVVYRNNTLFYTQTIGLPAGTLTRTAVQWTKLNATSGAFMDGGRIDDPTATATNGGKWYAYPHIAVNSVGDFIVGYTQFSSAQHPSTGYSIHMAADGAGTIRDPQIYHVGEDYYHKTFSTATGRNRWGDFSTAQVDPSDDRTLWTLQEYAKTRTGTDDGNTGSNSSKWSSWWAGVKTAYTITASAGPGGSISPSGAVTVITGANQTFTITPNACQHIVDVLVDGVSVGAVGSYTFTNVTADHTISASFAINTYTIVATANAGGTISPSGSVPVNCGSNVTFTITPGACAQIADVVVDGSSVGAVASYTFSSVSANHTITASFSLINYTITASAGSGGSISPNGAVVVPCGGSQTFAIEPSDKCHFIADVLVDGVSVGAVATYTFSSVSANHTIAASFGTYGPFTLTASAGPGGSITPSGAVQVACGGSQTFAIEASDKCHGIADVLVDGVSVGAVTTYTFTDVQANHTIEASFYSGGPFTITASAGPGGSITPSGGVSVDCGGSQTYAIEPADKCHFISNVLVDGVSVGAVASFTFSDVQANHTIAASFGLLGPYTITASAGAGGSISPNGPVQVACGAAQDYAIEPADKCHVIADVLVDGVSVGPVSTYTFTDVQANHTIDASFTLLGPYTITASAGAGGSITPSGPVSVACGGSQTFAIEPSGKCWAIADVKVDGFSVGPVTTYTFTDVQANHTIDATFVNGGPFTITASAGPGGSISPNGAVSVACGGEKIFTITPDAGFDICDVLVDGVSVGTPTSYAFGDVQANHTISASFCDVQCPSVAVIVPNGGESLIIGLNANLTWSATDNVGVTCVDIYLSRTGVGGPFSTIALCIPNSGSYTWLVTGPATTNAYIKVVAHDAAGNACEDLSDSAFKIEEVVVPVLLSQFQVEPLDGAIRLRWAVSEEAAFVRTIIQRADAVTGPWTDLVAPVQFDKGQSVLVDQDVVNGQTYFYRLSGLTRSGQTVTFEALSATPGQKINQFTLPPVKPNPTRGTAHVTFTVPVTSRVRVAVFDIQGREVTVLADRTFGSGQYELTWNGEGHDGRVPSGTYFVRLDSGATQIIQRVTVYH